MRPLLLLALALLGACASTNPDTAGEIGAAFGKGVGGVLKHTPVVGSVLDSADAQRARLGEWREGRREARAVERARAMQFQQCAANPCLYGSVCAQLFPHFLLPSCSGASAEAGALPPPSAAPAPPELPPAAGADPEPPASGKAEPALDAGWRGPPWRPMEVDRGHEPCARELMGGAWRCWDGDYQWDPKLEYEWNGSEWIKPAASAGGGR